MSREEISTDSYKGVRDFYPAEAAKKRYIEFVMRQTVESFGFQEVETSLLEPAELYDAKSGDELAQEQSYRFEDRGGREVMLRPEMTPSVARLVAGQVKSLPLPVRWYSIANVFRYEKPQRGRLREHWQLNADLFGADGAAADVEIILLAHELLENFGAEESDFLIKVSSRGLFRTFCSDVLEIAEDTTRELSRLVDKKDKLDSDTFAGALADMLTDKQVSQLKRYLSTGDTEELAEEFPAIADELAKVSSLLDGLVGQEVGNAIFAPELMRGLDYYTGVVFEIFDTNPENNRALFGGGRFDNLLDMFDTEHVPAVGFGAGDVTLADFLDVHDLWPEIPSALDVSVCLVDPDEHAAFGYQVARKLRESGVKTRVDISSKNVGTQISGADEAGAEFVTIIGDDEIDSETVTFKKLSTGDETAVPFGKLSSAFVDSPADESA